MTEQEYINATNKAKIRAAMVILEDIDARDVGKQERTFRDARIMIRQVEAEILELVGQLEESE